jgi:hypothetical protein
LQADKLGLEERQFVPSLSPAASLSGPALKSGGRPTKLTDLFLSDGDRDSRDISNLSYPSFWSYCYSVEPKPLILVKTHVISAALRYLLSVEMREIQSLEYHCNLFAPWNIYRSNLDSVQRGEVQVVRWGDSRRYRSGSALAVVI